MKLERFKQQYNSISVFQTVLELLKGIYMINKVLLNQHYVLCLFLF